MSGSLVTFVSFLIAHFSLPLRKGEYVCLGLSVFLGCYAIALAWREEHRKLTSELAKSTSPVLKSDIDCVIRGLAHGGFFLVHVHIVNVTRAAFTIRSVLLLNQSTGEMLPAVAFTKVSRLRQGLNKISIDLTEQGFSKTESRMFDQINDSLKTIRSTTFQQGIGLNGWLLFKKPFDLAETPCPSLSLLVDDAFGSRHIGETLNEDYEMGTVF